MKKGQRVKRWIVAGIAILFMVSLSLFRTYRSHHPMPLYVTIGALLALFLIFLFVMRFLTRDDPVMRKAMVLGVSTPFKPRWILFRVLFFVLVFPSFYFFMSGRLVNLHYSWMGGSILLIAGLYLLFHFVVKLVFPDVDRR